MTENYGRAGAIVALAIGERYKRNFDREFRDSFARYAARIGRDLVVIDAPLRPSEKHPAWQKLLIFDHPKLAGREGALFIDSDVYITAHAKDPFALLGGKLWAAALNNPYGIASLAKTDLELYSLCPAEGRPDMLLNTGVFVVSSRIRPMLEEIFKGYPDQRNWENGPLSYHLLNRKADGTILPPEFNTIAYCYRQAHGWGLSTVLKMYRESSFIHFAGNKSNILLPLIRYIDTHEKSLLTKLIRLIGAPALDPLTAAAIRAAEQTRAAYRFHIKRRLSGSSASRS